MKAIWAALLLGLTCTRVDAAIVLDGKLDEPEWASAQRLSSFKTTEPNTQAEPELKTEVRVYADAAGLYIGYICDQPPSVERVRTRGQRDQFVPGDRVVTMIDFDGSGTTGYEFTAYLGGEKMDSVISHQVNSNYDWDGEWDYAVSETDAQWFVEYRIPWSVAPLGDIKDGQRILGVFVQRVVTQYGKRYSQPANAYARATFVADMQKIRVAGYEKPQLDLYPYAGASYDALSKVGKGRAGLDVFWKPSGTQQLTATVNPDFGQVESDQLVVNFSAIPVFFPDKRPFFTENLSLFTTEFNILYTRRIGAAPDTLQEGVSDIAGALKYTGTSGDLAYGAIAVREDDTGAIEGRSFYVGRLREKFSDALTLGWIGTYTERPTLDRRANVNGVDLAWTISPGVSLRGTGVISHVDKATSSVLSPAGTGEGQKWVFSYAPGGALESTTFLASKGQDFNINDAGFQSRPGEHVLRNLISWYWRDWAPDSAVQQSSLFSSLLVRRNDGGRELPAEYTAVYETNRKDTRTWGLEYDGVSIGGVDDLLTRGNGPVHLPTRHQFFPYYMSPRSGLFRYLLVCGVGTGNFQDHGWESCRFEPGLYPSDALSLSMIAGFTRSPDEILWQGGNLLGAFDYQETNVSADINWFPADKHSLRVKFQWIAASGDHAVPYRPDAEGTLGMTADTIPDFSFTTTALQLRYRWEFAPQSELFAVYSRGGFDDPGEAERSYGASLRRGLAHETASQFLLKIRYRFAVL